MLRWVRMIAGLLSDVLTLGVLCVRTSSAVRAENLVLRRQLARYIERGIKPRRVDHETRVSLALFSRLFEWRNAVVTTCGRRRSCVGIDTGGGSSGDGSVGRVGRR